MFGGAERPQGTCRAIGHRHVVDETGCDLFAVNVNICSGSCWSLSFVDPRQSNAAGVDGTASEPVVAVFAQCCRMVEAQMLNVSIPCEDGPRTVQIPSATNCSCFDCSRRRRRRR
uniref:DAN domain-containing protein n=1 Tax=Globodera pallida TaxID=36090 RepID=A0A183BRQ7_GLOPA